MYDDDENARERARLMELGRAAAAVSARRSVRLADTLSSLPSNASPLDMGGAQAIHYLRRHDGRRSAFDYCARIDLPGPLPRLLLLGGGADDDDERSSGPRTAFPHSGLSQLVRARTRAPDVLRPFALDDVLAAWPKAAVRVAVQRINDRLSVLEVDVDVGPGTDCEGAAALAVLLGRIALAVVSSGATFSEARVDTRAPVEQLESLLQVLTNSTSWLSGPAARVGDGVEARLELDELPERPCIIRVDFDAQQRAVVKVQAPLRDTPEKTTTLSPQHGVVGAVLGLLDQRVGDNAFDDAWHIDGDVERARVLSHAEGDMLALRRVQATVSWGPDGLDVRVPPMAFEASDVGDVVEACLRLWRRVVRHLHENGT
jgi:hypothetical protein